MISYCVLYSRHNNQGARRVAKVYVRRLGTREIVKEIEVGNPTPRTHETFMLGLLRNMNTDSFYVDDDEVRFERRYEPTTRDASQTVGEG